MVARRVAGMVVIADQALLQPDVLHQLAGHAGIFTGYRSHATQCRYGTVRDVAKIANRGRDNIEPGRKRCIHQGLLDAPEGSDK